MVDYIHGINPAIVKWAREQSGYSVQEIASVFSKDISIINEWESGARALTYTQLETLADKYKRSIVIFFLPNIPEEPNIAENLSLRSSDIKKLKPKTLTLFRQAFSRQISLMELNLETNPVEEKIFRDLQVQSNQSSIELAEYTREYLNVSVEKQAGWKNEKEALANWRDLITEKGVYVFKDAFKDDLVDGFCLIHNEFPVIYINNSRPSVRQIFSLFHELGHVLLGKNGITPDITGIIKSISEDIEVYCNQFANEFLVPSKDFEKRLNFSEYDDEAIGELAKFYKVSRPVILLKLIKKGVLKQEIYDQRVKEWDAQYKMHKIREGKIKNQGGGDYYNTRLTYLGSRYTRFAFEKYRQGFCSIEKLADHLDFKAKNLAKLEERLLKKATS